LNGRALLCRFSFVGSLIIAATRVLGAPEEARWKFPKISDCFNDSLFLQKKQNILDLFPRICANSQFTQL